MQKFHKLSAIAAPLPIQNVDTDMIIPKQFLKTIKRTGLAEGLFYEMRYDEQDQRREDFILHQAPWTKAEVLISGDNFGCGSSREHAPWALLDFGIRCIIAPSFADIFYNNCFKNGILPIKLTSTQTDELMHVAEAGEKIMVDLQAQTITAGSNSYPFEIDPFRKKCLLEGLDDIGLTQANANKITEFEQNQQHKAPWLYKKPA